jgi:hypothetical protein
MYSPHGTTNGKITNPNIPADREKISSNLAIMEVLAELYIRIEKSKIMLVSTV